MDDAITEEISTAIADTAEKDLMEDMTVSMEYASQFIRYDLKVQKFLNAINDDEKSNATGVIQASNISLSSKEFST